jgi:hypothetical protein
MTLDIYAGLFDDGLDNGAMRLNAVVSTSDGQSAGKSAIRELKNRGTSGIRGFQRAETVGFEPTEPLEGSPP